MKKSNSSSKTLVMYIAIIAGVVVFILYTLGMFDNLFQKEDAFAQVKPELEELMSDDSLEVITLAGGCFWCMEGPFEALDGVREAIAGYSGGSVEYPTYSQVTSGGTGHREAVQIFFDPSKTPLKDILETYWRQIDPTDEGGQFADRGHSYTTAIYYHTQQQKEEAMRQIQELEEKKMYDKPIVTKVEPFTNFYPAEDYHQDFYQKSSEYYKKYAKGSGRADYIAEMEKKFSRE